MGRRQQEMGEARDIGPRDFVATLVLLGVMAAWATGAVDSTWMGIEPVWRREFFVTAAQVIPVLLLALTTELVGFARMLGSDRTLHTTMVASFAVGATGLALALGAIVAPGRPPAGFGAAVAFAILVLLLWLTTVASAAVVRTARQHDRKSATELERRAV